ncbi:MAG: cation:dicarboxylase symporter family transporter, partial [Bacteroidetes bacterium]|nr:cation:dicarboxylase symporter family transporter [Bacteroidota bacterium]MBU1760354.1 cation:dicarboxylase symporter family transporter [Bacteroidota bacterium]
MKIKRIPLILLITVFIAALATIFNHYHIVSIPENTLIILRWIALTSLFAYGVQRKSLTTWILISMVIGAEIGHDFSEIAINLQVLSKVFLKMIKTIVAPLLFATLVFGIAGHSDLKQVGRMGWKSLLYFEVVTTLALFIGVLAINISKAGVGIKPPAVITETLEKVEPQSATDIILHVFPENIAKSMAEGQVLQVVVFSIIFGIALAMVREDKRRPML